MGILFLCGALPDIGGFEAHTAAFASCERAFAFKKTEKHEIEPGDLLKIMNRPVKQEIRMSGEEVADIWIQYDLNRPAAYHQIPSIFEDKSLRHSLEAMFQIHPSRRKLKRFMLRLKLKDSELYEIALKKLEIIQKKRLKRSIQFDPHEAVDLWVSISNSQGELSIPDKHLYRNLNTDIWHVIRNRFEQTKVEEFVHYLYSRSTALYKVFAETVTFHYRPRVPRGNKSEGERWAKEWADWYGEHRAQSIVAVFVDHASLGAEISYYLSLASGSKEQRMFLAEMKKQNPMLRKIVSQYSKLILNPHSDLPEPKRTMNEIVLSADFALQLYLARFPLWPNKTKETIRLVDALYRYRSGANNEIYIKDFLRSLRLQNRLLWLAFRDWQKRHSQGWTKKEEQAEKLALEWLDYYWHKSKEHPNIPSHGLQRNLYLGLRKYLRRQVTESERQSLLEKVRYWDTSLYRVAIDSL